VTNSARYVVMIRNFLVPELRRRWLNQFWIWFQQDGASAQTSREAMAELRRLFPGKLISHRGDVPCLPPPSPDQSPCDFFLWGYLKGKVYVDTPRDIPQLQNAVEQEKRAIPRRMCEQVMTNFSRRLNMCVQNKGCHLNDVIFHVWQFFLKCSYGILKLQHLLYLLKILKIFFFHENWLCTTSFKTVWFHWRTLYNCRTLTNEMHLFTGGPCTITEH